MNLIFEPISPKHAELILQWRSSCPEALRTPKSISLAEQTKWLEEISSKKSNTYFWMIKNAEGYVGYCGIENIQWTNSLGEISLLVAPGFQGQGIGRSALTFMFETAFMELNLENLFGECYFCNKNVDFWEKMIKNYNGLKTNLPMRKYWLGSYWSSLYFTFNKTMSLRAVRLGYE